MACRCLRSLWILSAAVMLTGCGVALKAAQEPSQEAAKPRKREVGSDWHWFANTFIEPTRECFRVRRWGRRATGHPIEAENVGPEGNPVGSVVFTARDASRMSPAEVARGPNSDNGPVGKITFKKAKTTGASPGFFGCDARGVKYLFKFDIPDYPEMASGAEIVGNRLMYALGYNVPEGHIFTMRDTGTEFDGKRCAAIRFVPGEVLGPWSFRRNRDRREVRALKIASAWINNTDIKEINSLMTWQDGKLKVYLIDFGNSLGSHTIGPKSPKSGWEHTFDVDEFWRQAFTLGLCGKPYSSDKKVFSKAVGLFDADFDPARWKPNYPEFSFSDLTPADARWMARKIAAFTEAQIRAAVSEARYADPKDADYIVGTLITRQEVIREKYLK